MDKVKVLLVGIGGYGENYIKAMFPSAINEDCLLLAVCDPFILNLQFKCNNEGKLEK